VPTGPVASDLRADFAEAKSNDGSGVYTLQHTYAILGENKHVEQNTAWYLWWAFPVKCCIDVVEKIPRENFLRLTNLVLPL